MRERSTGNIIQGKDGTWQGSLQAQKRRVTVYGRSKAEVKEKLNQLRKQTLLEGGFPEKNAQLYELLDKWLNVCNSSCVTDRASMSQA